MTEIAIPSLNFVCWCLNPHYFYVITLLLCGALLPVLTQCITLPVGTHSTCSPIPRDLPTASGNLDKWRWLMGAARSYIYEALRKRALGFLRTSQVFVLFEAQKQSLIRSMQEFSHRPRREDVSQLWTCFQKPLML